MKLDWKISKRSILLVSFQFLISNHTNLKNQIKPILKTIPIQKPIFKTVKGLDKNGEEYKKIKEELASIDKKFKMLTRKQNQLLYGLLD